MAASLQRWLVRGVSLRRIPVHPLFYFTKRTLNWKKLFSFDKEFVFNKDSYVNLTKEYDFSEAGLKNKLRELEIKNLIKDQTFREERVKTLGSDLAAANFIIARGGAVKFVNKDTWVKKTGVGFIKLPRKFDPDFKLEGIDCSKMKLMYVGLDNLVDLEHLKYINFSSGKFVDDWFLARLHIYRDSLEFLDISGCMNVTERGILALHHLRKLKGLKITDCKFVKNQELIAVLLEELIPDLQVIGVDKSTNILPEDVKVSDRLKEDMKNLDFQALQSRFLRMGDMLDEMGKKINTGAETVDFSVSTDVDLDSYIEEHKKSSENEMLQDVRKAKKYVSSVLWNR